MSKDYLVWSISKYTSRWITDQKPDVANLEDDPNERTNK